MKLIEMYLSMGLDVTLLALGGSIPIGFTTAVNIGAFRYTKNWLQSHQIDESWYLEIYEEFRKRSKLHAIAYHLSYPGRKIAYSLYSNKK